MITSQSQPISLYPIRQCISLRSFSHRQQPIIYATSDPSQTPLVDAIVQRGRQLDDIPFHVPGHKRGSSTSSQLVDILQNPLQFDLTELPGLDYLSYPDGPILHAQQLAAQCFGADQTWFLVNGTTVGIHAAVMATCHGPNDALLLGRNAHLSAFNAAVLSGCTPVYVQPEYAHGMAHHVSPTALKAAFVTAEQQGLNCRAALIVSPTYFGILSDIAGLSQVCTDHNAILIVDEAHGAHFKFIQDHMSSSSFENQQYQRYCPLAAGADIAIQSTHKQLASMTQSAMLHIKGSRVDPTKISRALQVLQTSSPSYLLMASLDAARAQVADDGGVAIKEPHAAAMKLQHYLTSKSEFLHLLTPESITLNSSITTDSTMTSHRSSRTPGAIRDPWRCTILFNKLGNMTGWHAAEILEQQYNIIPELANHNSVVFAIGIGSRVSHVDALVTALDSMIAEYKTKKNKEEQNPNSIITAATAAGINRYNWVLEQQQQQEMALPEISLTPREAFFSASEAVPIQQAAGRISAELLCPYPPGVPAVYPGEVIEQQALDYVLKVVENGGKVVGCADATLQYIQVVVGAG